MSLHPTLRSRHDSCLGSDDFERFLVGGLPYSTTEELVAHIESCSACLAYLETLGERSNRDAERSNGLLGLAGAALGARHIAEDGCRRLAEAAKKQPNDAQRVGTKDSQGSVPPQQLGRYQILSEIGRGGFGRVFKAYDPKLDCNVAIKLLSDNGDSELLLKEARIVASLQHPSIVPVLNISDSGEHDYIVMNLVEGQSLKRLISTGRISVSRALGIMISVCEGVAFAHSMGVIHRDIKPENILIDRTGRAFVTDFGLAWRPSKQFPLNEVAGTTEFMSPEQLAGDLRFIDVRSDIWAIGATLFAMLHRQSPFRRGSREETVKAIEEGSIPELSGGRDDVPPVLDLVYQRCLARSPGDRYQTIGELVKEFRSLSDRRVWRLSFAEWAKVRFRGDRSAKRTLFTRREAIRAADRRYLMAMAGSILFVGASAGVGYEYSRYLAATNLLDKLIEPDRTYVAGLLTSPVVRDSVFRSLVRRKLLSLSENDRDVAFKLRLAAWVGARDEVAALAAMIPHADAKELDALRETLVQVRVDAASLESALEAIATSKRPKHEQLRIQCAKVICGAQALTTSPREIAESLLDEDSLSVEQFADQLFGVKKTLQRAMIAAMTTEVEGRQLTTVQAAKAVTAMLEWSSDEREHIELLEVAPHAELIRVVQRIATKFSSAKEFHASLASIEGHYRKAEAKLQNEHRDRHPLEIELDKLAEYRCRIVLVLAAMGDRELLYRNLVNQPDPRVRTCLIDSLDAIPLAERLVPELLGSSEATCRSATLLSMIALDRTPELEAAVFKLYMTDRDAGVHFAAEWLLHKWRLTNKVKQLRKELQRKEPNSEFGWFEHSSGLSFAILNSNEPFLVGSPEGEFQRNELMGGIDVERQQSVILPRKFAISVKEITQAQFFSLMPREDLTKPSDTLPVKTSFEQAVGFCESLSRELPGCRLPSGSEWEYACRAGTSTTRFTGYSPELLHSYAVFGKAKDAIEPVGGKRPNAFGMFDMLGNLSEYTNEPIRGISGPICRGMWETSKAIELRAAARHGTIKDRSTCGFRVVMELT